MTVTAAGDDDHHHLHIHLHICDEHGGAFRPWPVAVSHCRCCVLQHAVGCAVRKGRSALTVQQWVGCVLCSQGRALTVRSGTRRTRYAVPALCRLTRDVQQLREVEQHTRSTGSLGSAGGVCHPVLWRGRRLEEGAKQETGLVTSCAVAGSVCMHARGPTLRSGSLGLW